MKKIKLVGFLLALIMSVPALAFSTIDEQIDSYLQTLDQSSVAAKRKVLERLQWSGLTDARLYDEIEKTILSQYQTKQKKTELKLLFYYVRALGYSGNEKYRSTLNEVHASAAHRNTRKYAKKALADFDRYVSWNELIANSEAGVTGKSAEITAYFKMLNTDNAPIQRMAAKATYHQQLQDNDLLQLFKNKLEAMYLKPDLTKLQQDAGAWFSKAIGQSEQVEYGEFLTTVVENTPYKQIRKHAAKYAQ